MSRTKLPDHLSGELGPTLNKAVIYAVKNPDIKYSLRYDETTQASVKKQMDLLIR